MKSNPLLKGNFGIFNHYLYSGGDWLNETNSLDIKKLAKGIARTGASRYFITIMQGRKYMLAPNSTFDRIAGTKPGEACAIRDIPMELGLELQKYDIDLYLYYTGDGPYKDEEVGEKFGFLEPRENVSLNFVKKWAAVLQEYSERYGTLVKGWWIDGCYDYFGYNDELLSLYYKACKFGNPDCVVSMNNGVIHEGNPTVGYSNEDFTSGEYNDFTEIPNSQFIDGTQVHILTPLGVSTEQSPAFAQGGWCCTGVKRNAEYLAEYIKKLKEVPCPITIDIKVYPDGSLVGEQVATLEKVSKLLNK